jgi:peptide/nickel transport system permease protein
MVMSNASGLRKHVAFKEISSVVDATVQEKEAVDVAQRTPKQIAWNRFKQNRTGVIAGIISIGFILAAYAAPLIVQIFKVGPYDLYLDQLDPLKANFPIGTAGGISWAHPFGVTPEDGRDIFANVLFGSRISFTVAIITTISSIGLGMLLGITAGYFRGRVDALIGRYSDFLFAFPSFFMIIALSLPAVERIQGWGIAQGNNARLLVLIVFLVFFGWPGFARLVRSQALSLRERDFVMAAQAQGASNFRIITKELLPNLWSTAIIFLSLALPGYLAAEAVFAYLGIGVQPPAISFGLLLDDARKSWSSDPAYLLITSGYLIAIVLSLNLLGDAIRDAIDPKADR